MTKTTPTTWIPLIIISLAAFIISFDTTFMNVAIINLVQDLNTTVGAVQAIITIYALTMASLMLAGAKIQDIMGRKRTFTIGAILYGIGALIATLSQDQWMLLLGWSILEGIGAALMLPATVSILTGTYHDKERALALGAWTGVFAMAAAVGPLLGGFLATYLSWRYGFGMEVLIIIGILLTSRWLMEFPTTITWDSFDVKGAILSSAGIFLIVLGILMLNEPANRSLIPYILFAGALLIIIFYLWQKRLIKQQKDPLLDVRLFNNSIFSVGSIIRLMGNMAIAGIIFISPVFLEAVLGGNALTTGIALLPFTISVMILSLLASKISNYIKPIHLITFGLIIAIVGCLMLRNTFNLETTIWEIMPGTTLIGIGCGLIFPLSANLVLTSAGKKESDASGVMNTVGNLGSAMGTAIIGIILILGIYAGLAMAVEDQLPGQYSSEEISTHLHGWVQKLQTTDLSGFKGKEKTKLGKIVDETIARAMNTTFDGLAIMFFLGLLCSLYLWRKLD